MAAPSTAAAVIAPRATEESPISASPRIARLLYSSTCKADAFLMRTGQHGRKSSCLVEQFQVTALAADSQRGLG